MRLRGNRLKAVRRARGLTQEQLAEMIDVNVLQIYRWETEKNDPSSSFVAEIACVLNTSIDYLMGLTDESDIQESDLAPDEQQLINAYRAGKVWDIIRLLNDRSSGMLQAVRKKRVAD